MRRKVISREEAKHKSCSYETENIGCGYSRGVMSMDEWLKVKIEN